MKKQFKFFPGLTTTPGSDWKEKIKEIDQIGLKEVALFPTYLKEDRKEFYELLEKSPLESAPLVHLRGDMERWEIDLFLKRFKTEKFNIHYNEAEFLENNPDLKEMTYVENGVIGNEFYQLLDNCAGLCLDATHYYNEGVILNRSYYNNFDEVMKKYQIGFCHVGAIKDKPNSKGGFEGHYLDNLSEFDFLKKLKPYLAQDLAIELENSFEKQVGMADYLNKLLND